MRWVVLAVFAACGRVGFDPSVTRTDGSLGSDYLVWLPFDDVPTDGAENRGTASSTA